MALYHFSLDHIKRTAGHTAIAAAAYRAGEKLYDSNYGETQDYSRKKGVMRKIYQMKRVMRNKDHGQLLFITSAACMSRSMSGMGSELIGGTLKPKYHSDSAGRRVSGICYTELDAE